MNLFIKFCPNDATVLLVANVLAQIAFIAALAWLLSLSFARHRPAVRHGIWASAFLCVLISPLVSYVAARAGLSLVSLRLLPQLASADLDVRPQPTLELASVTRPPAAADRQSAESDEGAGPDMRAFQHGVASPYPVPAGRTDIMPTRGLGDQRRALVGLATLLWAVGVVFLVVRLFHGWRSVLGLRRGLYPATGDQFQAILAEVRRVLNISSLPRLAILPKGTRCAGPITIGLFRPVVILPEDLISTLDSRGLRDVLVHESAHALRHDPLVGFLQRLLTTVFWPYPPVHLVNRWLARAREEVCDNYVLRQGDAPSYAETLLIISEMFRYVRMQPAALGICHPCGRLEERVAGLLNPRRNVMTGVHRTTLAALTALFLTTVVVVAGTRLLRAEPPAATAADAAPAVQRRAVNKLVKNFPAKADLSTPESALAAICRTVGRKDMLALNDLMLSRLDKSIALEIEDELKHDPNGPKDLDQKMLGLEIVEVWTYGDDFACVICKPKTVSLYAPERPYAISLLLKSDGKWKGNDPWKLDDPGAGDPRFAPNERFATVSAARDHFDKNKDSLRKSCIEAKGKKISFPAKADQSNKTAAKGKAGVGKSGPQPWKQAIAAKTEPVKPEAVAGTQPLDPKIVELGKAVKKRITTWSDEATLTLKNGQTGRMKVKKNITPVMEILLTPHFVKNGTTFDLEGVDAAGKAIEGAKTSVHPIHDGQASRMGLSVLVKGEPIMAKIQLKPTRKGEESVVVEVKALFTRLATPKEIEALLLSSGKNGQLHLNFQTVSRWIMEYEQSNGRYPKTLAELAKPLPKDVYSPTGEPIHYEARQDGYILSSCGRDGVYGNADDEIYWRHSRGTTSGTRHELYPLEADKEARSRTKSQTELVRHGRPHGNCSIAGSVVDETTGQPVPHARMYLFYLPTFSAVFVNTDTDGTFIFNDIPIGPHALQSSRTRGYQDAQYNPEGKPGQFPQFSLKEGEHRGGIVLKVKKACRIAGKVLDENGKTPERVKNLNVLAWFKKDDGKDFTSQHVGVNNSDGSFVIDGLADKPVYVMAIDWRTDKEDHAYPPIYYPSTFSRSQAKLITFDKGPNVENVNITRRKEGGLAIAGTVRDDAGKPIPEAFVVVHRRDMLFDFVTAYSDRQGHYEIHGLGDGEFLMHVNAAHRGFVRTAASVDLDGHTKNTQRDFTLKHGVLISGRFVDKQGNPWKIAQSFGHAHVMVEQERMNGSFTLTGFDSKYAPPTVRDASGSSFNVGEGPYYGGEMLFPTTSTFMIQGMMPGHTILNFMPQKVGQKVMEIRHDGHDILKSGIDTKPGQELRDVTIVIAAQ